MMNYFLILSTIIILLCIYGHMEEKPNFSQCMDWIDNRFMGDVPVKIAYGAGKHSVL